jgi:hypothetical protein
VKTSLSLVSQVIHLSVTTVSCDFSHHNTCQNYIIAILYSYIPH